MASSSSLEIAILGLLKEGPMHGYEIRKRLGVTLGPLWTVSFGSLYPCLRRLRKAGLVQETGKDEPKKRKRTSSKKSGPAT
ncbi:MAG: PadR family transcriptional regulator, partial [Actinobacteria bacterium]|nr:PadR family transcriptional regulator [Actinomycetota bacterium]